MTNVAIILVNWNGKKDTLTCLSSLYKLQHDNVDVKVIVVDNGSTDDSVVQIKKYFKNIEVIETGRNLGFPGGNNAGIRRAMTWGSDYIWLLNNDTVVDSKSLQPLLEAFRDKTVGIAGSKIYFASGHEYHKSRYLKKEYGHVLWYAGGLIDWKNMYASHRGVDEVDSGQYDIPEETMFVTGCSMMIRNEVISSIGILDEKFFMYFEDVDFCLRTNRLGWKCIYIPTSIVWHVNAGSSGSPGSDTHQYYQTRNRLIVGMRYAPIRTKFALLREAMLVGLTGPSIRKRAVFDALTGRWGMG